MTDLELKKLKEEAHQALEVATTKLYDYACKCELGEGRERAFEIYQNARLAPRVG